MKAKRSLNAYNRMIAVSVVFIVLSLVVLATDRTIPYMLLSFAGLLFSLCGSLLAAARKPELKRWKLAIAIFVIGGMAFGVYNFFPSALYFFFSAIGWQTTAIPAPEIEIRLSILIGALLSVAIFLPYTLLRDMFKYRRTRRANITSEIQPREGAEERLTGETKKGPQGLTDEAILDDRRGESNES